MKKKKQKEPETIVPVKLPDSLVSLQVKSMLSLNQATAG